MRPSVSCIKILLATPRGKGQLIYPELGELLSLCLCKSLTMADRDPNTGHGEKMVKLHVKEDVDENENIPHPTLELYRHTMLRGANVGSLLTLLVGTPVLLFRGVRQPTEFLRRLSSACAKGVGIGMGLVALATMARIWNDADEQIYDRAYRLRNNKGQVRMDKFTYGSALAGGLVGMAATPNWSVIGGIQGASVGIGLAVFAHALTSPKEKKN